MPELSYVDALISSIKTGYGYTAEHIESVAVNEVFKGQTIWIGIVEVFKLKDCPKTDKCYGWGFEKEKGKMEFITVLGISTITTPQKAVQVYITGQSKQNI